MNQTLIELFTTALCEKPTRETPLIYYALKVNRSITSLDFMLSVLITDFIDCDFEMARPKADLGEDRFGSKYSHHVFTLIERIRIYCRQEHLVRHERFFRVIQRSINDVPIHYPTPNRRKQRRDEHREIACREIRRVGIATQFVVRLRNIHVMIAVMGDVQCDAIG